MEENIRKQVTMQTQHVRNREKEHKLIVEKRLEKLNDPVKILEFRFAVRLHQMLDKMKE